MEAVKRNERTKLTVDANGCNVVLDNDDEDILGNYSFDEDIQIYTSSGDRFDGNTDREVKFTSLGRATFNFHVLLTNDSGIGYSTCVNFAGKIWMIKNDPSNPESCSR